MSRWYEIHSKSGALLAGANTVEAAQNLADLQRQATGKPVKIHIRDDSMKDLYHNEQALADTFLEQTAAAAAQTREDEARIQAEGLTLELAQPLRPEQLGGKRTTDEQPGLFGPQQRRLFE